MADAPDGRLLRVTSFGGREVACLRLATLPSGFAAKKVTVISNARRSTVEAAIDSYVLILVDAKGFEQAVAVPLADSLSDWVGSFDWNDADPFSLHVMASGGRGTFIVNSLEIIASVARLDRRGEL